MVKQIEDTRNDETSPEKLISNPLWKKTYDKIGLVPTFPLICPFCLNARGVKEEMVLRHSNIHRVADIRVRFGIKEHRPYAFDNAYKCPACAFYCVFGIAIDMEYAQKILELRGHKSEYIVPQEIWIDDERVAKVMDQYGYWGGGGEW